MKRPTASRLPFVTLIFAVILTQLTAGVPASAGTSSWSYEDPRADAKPVVDVVKTSLDVRKKGYYRVRVKGREFIKDSTDMVRVYFDTRRQNTGPEYRVSWYLGDNPAYNVGSVMLKEIDSWNTEGTKVACKGIRRSVNYATDVIIVSVPRRCLDRPQQIRWSGLVMRVTSAEGSMVYGYWDWFPKARRFSKSWVD